MRRRKREGQVRGRGVKCTKYRYNKLQGYVKQHGEYSEYFIITINAG